MKTEKEIYYLNGETLPTIPLPHDCVIKSLAIKDQCMEFVFEDDISYHDSIKYYRPDAKSLIMRTTMKSISGSNPKDLLSGTDTISEWITVGW